jgi:hypothetical protein
MHPAPVVIFSHSSRVPLGERVARLEATTGAYLPPEMHSPTIRQTTVSLLLFCLFRPQTLGDPQFQGWVGLRSREGR